MELQKVHFIVEFVRVEFPQLMLELVLSELIVLQ